MGLFSEMMDEAGEQANEIARLRGLLRRHFAFARFVHLWVNRDNVTDAERISVIKHHPDLRKWVEGDPSNGEA